MQLRQRELWLKSMKRKSIAAMENYGGFIRYIIQQRFEIGTTSLDALCEETTVSLPLMETRWRPFGHILRQNPEIPANKTYLQTIKTNNY